MEKFLSIFLVPLITTIVGGIVVFFASSYWTSDSRALTWGVEATNTLNILDMEYTSQVIRVKNTLDYKVTDLEISIGASSDIADFQVGATIEGRKTEEFRVSGTSSERTILLPILRSNEEVTLQVLLKSDTKADYSLFVQSAEQIAKKERLEGIDTVWWKKVLKSPATPAILNFIIFAGLSFFMMRKLRTFVGKVFFFSPNNTAFVLIHTGAIDLAIEILEETIKKKGGGVYELSNLAGACALAGRHQDARRFLDAARFLADNDHRQTIMLNDAILSYSKGDASGATAILSDYAEQFPKETNYYLEHSRIMKEITLGLPRAKP